MFVIEIQYGSIWEASGNKGIANRKPFKTAKAAHTALSKHGSPDRKYRIVETTTKVVWQGHVKEN